MCFWVGLKGNDKRSNLSFFCVCFSLRKGLKETPTLGAGGSENRKQPQMATVSFALERPSGHDSHRSSLQPYFRVLVF